MAIPTVMIAKKFARSVTGQKLKFECEFMSNVRLKIKTLKQRPFVMKYTLPVWNRLDGTAEFMAQANQFFLLKSERFY